MPSHDPKNEISEINLDLISRNLDEFSRIYQYGLEVKFYLVKYFKVGSICFGGEFEN